MRETKFRGMTAHNQWVIGGYAKRGDKQYIIRDIDEPAIPVNSETVGQLIPYPYSKDVDLYDGDVLDCLILKGKYDMQIRYRNCLIEWTDLYAGIYLDGYMEIMSNVKFLDMNLIGNIHENPELI